MTTSFVVSVRLSMRMEQLGCYWTDFHAMWYLKIFFEKSVKKIQFSLKSDQTFVHLIKFFLEREMFHTKLYMKSKHTFYIQ
jgi:hypothetical protein